MANAPKEIWEKWRDTNIGRGSEPSYHDVFCAGYSAARAAAADRIEQLEAENAAAYKRGMEDAAKAVAEECDCAYATKAIRAAAQENDDV